MSRSNPLSRLGSNPLSRLGAGGIALAAIAATMSVSGCGGIQLCASQLPTGALGNGTVNSALQGSAQQSTMPGSAVTMPRDGAPTSAAQAGHGGKSGATAQLPKDSVITLPTGQQVRLSVSADGRQSATPVLSSGSARSAYLHFNWGADQYLIPGDAVPYLGTSLDPRLFDVSYLARAQAASPHSAVLPADVTPAGGGVAVPMTRAAAAKLGQTLASGWRPGKSAVTKAALARAGLSRVSLAPSSGVALPAALPGPASAGANAGNLKRHTLTVNFIGADGQPGAAAGWVQNLQNARYGTFFVMPNIIDDPDGSQHYEGISGPLKFSVPDGTYSLQFSIVTPHPGTAVTIDAALVVKPVVSVHGDTTVTLDARTAVPYHAAPADPVQHNLQLDTLSYFRGSAAGGGCGTYQSDLGLGLVSVSGSGDNIGAGKVAAKISASPTGQVSEGTLGFVASTSIGDLASDGTVNWPDAPEYDMSFPYWGQIPPSLSFTVPAKDFATVSQKLYADQNADCPPETGRILRTYAFQPWGDWQELGGLDGWSNSVSSWPTGTYTSYLYSRNSKLTTWQIKDDYGVECNLFALARTTPLFATSPGEKITQTWNQGPSVPSAAAAPVTGPSVSLAGPEGTGRTALTVNPLLTVAPAARQDNNGMFNMSPAADADPSHLGDGVGTSTVNFYRDGKLAAAGTMAPTGGLDLPLLARPASYRLDWTTTSPVQQESSTTTSWQFRSSPGDPAAKLPEYEQCAPDASRACSLLPLLFLNYDLPVSLGNQAQAGTTMPFGITVSSQQGGAAPSGVKVMVAASFDDGKTWSAAQPATEAGGGKFTASIDQPALSATDGFGSLRVTATDGAGNSVTQTIIRAYGLTS